MTQTANDDFEFQFCHYVIGLFDVLGQSDQLGPTMVFPPATDEETEILARNVQETCGVVDQFRQLFWRQFKAREEEFDEYVSEMPTPQQESFRAHLGSNILHWGMSDTYVVAVPMVMDSPIAAMATMANLRRLLEAAAAAWLLSLATSHPIRGGVALGTGARMREYDVYGSALEGAYHLESSAADWPRIVVGEQLLAALQVVGRDPDVGFRRAAAFAAHCCSLLRHADGQAEIDVLGSWATADNRLNHPLVREALPRAHCYVQNQLLRYREQGDDTGVRRYERLLEYFDQHAPRWQEQ